MGREPPDTEYPPAAADPVAVLQTDERSMKPMHHHPAAPPFAWPAEGVTRVPFQLFSDPHIYACEQERIFRGPVWHFLCLELEVENTGDYRTSSIGDTPIIVARNRDGAVNAMVNRCAHKGALVCHKERGNAKALSCVYHSWTYDLTGQLMGLAFRDGLRGKGRHAAGFQGQGPSPATGSDRNLRRHGIRYLLGGNPPISRPISDPRCAGSCDAISAAP